MKICECPRTGEEWPGGSGVFHKTFFSGLNSTGRPVVSETPEPFGPRNCDQSSASAELRDNEAIRSATVERITLGMGIQLSRNFSRAASSHVGWILMESRRKVKSTCWGG